MKKFIALAIVLATITTTAFSRTNDDVNQQILSSFKKDYTSATEVKWEAKKDFMRATFRIDGQLMYAYYSKNGERVAVTRTLQLAQLPITLSASLKERLHNDEYWVADLFEMVSKGETDYYATLRSSTRTIVLKADGLTAWQVFKKTKR